MSCSRREFLNLISVFGAAAIIDACSPKLSTVELPPSLEQLMHPECIRLGEELSQWQLSSGKRMADLFPVVKQAAELLQGKTNPRKFIPSLQPPVGFVIGQEGVDRLYFKITPENNSRSIIALSDIVGPFTIPFPSITFWFQFSPEVMQNSVRWPVMVKETSQIIDSPEYCHTYVKLLKENGAKFELNNPENIPTTNLEINTAISYYLMSAELEQNGKSWFNYLVDYGSFIRTGVVFANWYLDQYVNGIQPQGRAVEIGDQVAGYLQYKGVIHQAEDKFVWTHGTPPEIGSAEFMELFNEIISNK